MNEIIQIIVNSILICLSSTTIAAFFGVPLGLLLGKSIKKSVLRIRPFISSLAGLPPVLAGITIFLLLSNSGPLGTYKLLYTHTAIIIAQVLIVLPLIIASVYPLVLPIKASFLETCYGLHISNFQQMFNI